MADFLIYGANGFLGRAIAHRAVESGLRPLLAGRNDQAVRTLAAELGLDHTSFTVDDPDQIDRALADVPAVINAAGPFGRIAVPIIESCIRTGTHYLDLNGEISVFQSTASLGPRAEAARVMLLSGVGFDVIATDCLALHLRQRLPSATKLTLAFHIDGPAPLPPGTAKSAVNLIHSGVQARLDGQVRRAPSHGKSMTIDFGNGPIQTRRLSWGDVFTAYHSTGIPNTQTYASFPSKLATQMRLAEYIRPLFKFAAVRNFVASQIPVGPSEQEQSVTKSHVWGQVEDDQGHRATARLHGPESGVVWSSNAALICVQRAIAGQAPAGFQTPAKAYGAGVVLECHDVTREDV
jgi:short subunit dehydrogenase-like uncharacterized protein